VREGRAETGQCLLHRRLGFAAKALACRCYPVVFATHGGQARAGLHFTCPAVVDGGGPPLEEDRPRIEALYREHEAARGAGGGGRAPDPGGGAPFARGLRVAWPALEAWEAVLQAVLRGTDPRPVDRQGEALRRLAWAAAAVDGSGEAALRWARTARRSGESFDGLAEAAAEAGEEARQGALPPGRLAFPERFLFRSVVAFCLAMGGADLAAARTGTARLRARMGRAWRVGRHMLGLGRWSGALEGVPLRAPDRVSVWPLPPESGGLLARYAAERLASRQYFGHPAWGLPALAGARLALLLPAVALCLARGFAARESRASIGHGDVRQGVMAADHVFGHLGAREAGGLRPALEAALRPGIAARWLWAAARPPSG